MRKAAPILRKNQIGSISSGYKRKVAIFYVFFLLLQYKSAYKNLGLENFDNENVFFSNKNFDSENGFFPIKILTLKN